MPSNDKDGGPAFPHHYDAGGPFPNYRSGSGMALRDYFAGQFMAAMLANGAPVSVGDLLGEKQAAVAYALADTMIAYRAKGIA